MRKLLSFLAVFILLSSAALAAETPAKGASFDADGAAKLQKQIADSLQWRLDMAKTVGNGLSMGGPVEVKPQGSFYEVKMPNMGLILASSGHLDIGTIVLHLTPAEAGAWNTEATIPSTMTFYDKTNAPQITLTIGQQHFTSLWWPDKDMYTKVDSALENIKADIKASHETEVTIGALKTTADLKDNGDGTWSGPIDFQTSDILVKIATTANTPPNSISLGRIVSHSMYDHLDLGHALTLRHDVQKALQEAAGKTDEERKRVIVKTTLRPFFSTNGIDTTLEADKLAIHSTFKDAQGGNKPGDISLDRLFFDATVSGLTKDKSKDTLKFGFSGFKTSFTPPILADLMPHTMNAEIAFDNIPIRQINDTMFDTMRKALDSPVTHAPDGTTQPTTQEQKEIADAMASLPMMLQTAGATMVIQNTYLSSTNVDMNLNGKFKAAPDAAIGVTGNAALSFKGLDEFIEHMKTVVVQPGGSMQAIGYIGIITALEMRGLPSKAADGKTLRTYNFELTKDGNMLLNGVSLKPAATPTSPVAPGKSPQNQTPLATPSPAPVTKP